MLGLKDSNRRWLLIGICVMFLQHHMAHAANPIQENIGALAEASAALNVCFQSNSYKFMNTEDALKLHDLDSRLSALAQGLSNTAKDNTHFMAFEYVRSKLSDDNDFVQSIVRKYGPCSSQLTKDMSQYVTDTEKTLSKYVTQ